MSRDWAVAVVRAGWSIEADREPVHAVDGDRSHGEIHEFLVTEMRSGVLIDVVGYAVPSESYYSFSPRQGGAFAVAVEGAFRPGAQTVQALFRLSFFTSIFGMDVDTVSAAVDLGYPDPDQFQKRLLQTTLPDVIVEPKQHLEAFRGKF